MLSFMSCIEVSNQVELLFESFPPVTTCFLLKISLTDPMDVDLGTALLLVELPIDELLGKPTLLGLEGKEMEIQLAKGPIEAFLGRTPQLALSMDAALARAPPDLCEESMDDKDAEDELLDIVVLVALLLLLAIISCSCSDLIRRLTTRSIELPASLLETSLAELVSFNSFSSSGT